MIKTIQIGDKEVALDNNVGWAMEYRDQFGRDIIPVLMPVLISGLDIAKELLGTIDADRREVTVEDLIALADSDAMIEAILHLSGLEFVDLINITWAMAKTADNEILEPKRWVKQFDCFSVDTVAPEVVGLILDGTVSSKNLERLKSRIKTIRPVSHSTTLSSLDSSEV